MATYQIIYDVEVRKHLAAIDRKYHPLIRRTIEKQLSQFPKDREIIVYCSCPNEVSSARLALRLQRQGFARVRPLLGGIDAWRELHYPMEPRTEMVTGSSVAALVTRGPSNLHIQEAGSSKSIETRSASSGEGKK